MIDLVNSRIHFIMSKQDVWSNQRLCNRWLLNQPTFSIALFQCWLLSWRYHQCVISFISFTCIVKLKLLLWLWFKCGLFWVCLILSGLNSHWMPHVSDAQDRSERSGRSLAQISWLCGLVRSDYCEVIYQLAHAESVAMN